MPCHCVVIGCKSRGYNTGRTFSSFPQLRKQSARTLALTQARQNAWLKALNRRNFFAPQFPHARVCDLHFVSGIRYSNIDNSMHFLNIKIYLTGKAAKFTDVDEVDWVPTLRLGYETRNTSTSQSNAVTEPMDEVTPYCPEFVEVPEASFDCVELTESNQSEESVQIDEKTTQTDVKVMNAEVQTDDTITGLSYDKVSSYLERIKLLEEMLVS